MEHTPDIIADACSAAHILVAQEAQEVDLVTRVTSRLAVRTRRARVEHFVAIFVEDTSRSFALMESHLALFKLSHANGMRRTLGTEVVFIVLGRVDPLRLCDGRAR